MSIRLALGLIAAVSLVLLLSPRAQNLDAPADETFRRAVEQDEGERREPEQRAPMGR